MEDLGVKYINVAVTVKKGETCRNEGGEVGSYGRKLNNVYGKIYSLFSLLVHHQVNK